MIFLLGAGLIVLVVGVFAFPVLSRNSQDLTRDESALSILHDQLSELDRDLSRGVIGQGEERAARLEIQRRIIGVTSKSSDGVVDPKSGGAALLVLSLVVPIAAVALYFNLGSPNMPSIPFADRSEEIMGKLEFDTLTTQLRTKLLSDADGGPTDGWILLGETYLRAERYAEASDAFLQLLDRPDTTSGAFSRYAEALIMDEGGTVAPRAERAIDQAIILEPSNPAATYYKALAMEQAGELHAAHGILLARLDLADGFYPWMESYVGLANFIAPDIGASEISLEDFAPAVPGPSDADVANAADMSETDRAAFITSMVERLATRLAQEPDDLDGWLQLAQAYTVLGQEDDARAAFNNASGLISDLPAADPRRQQVATGLLATQ